MAHYQIQYKKHNDNPETWHIKCNCKTREQAEKFLDVLENVSNVYSDLRIVSIQENEPGNK